jgi:hypothetical protein
MAKDHREFDSGENKKAPAIAHRSLQHQITKTNHQYFSQSERRFQK